MKRLFLLITLIALSSCKEEVAGPTKPRSFPSTLWNPLTSKAGYLISNTMRFEAPSGYEDRYDTKAVFYDTSGNVIVPSSSILNSHTLAVTNGIHNDQASVSFGATHQWQINGSGWVPSITDSIDAPKQFRITYPAWYVDSASKSGFTLQYEDPTTDSVYICIAVDSVFSWTRSKVNVSPTYVLVHTPNTGSYTFSSSDLSAFPNQGVIQMVVGATKNKNISVSGRDYVLCANSGAMSFTYLKN